MDQALWELQIGRFEQARDQFFASLGNSGFYLTPLMSYSLMGYPAWPVRDSWKIIQRPHSTIIMSDGLSDPNKNNGTSLGLEVAVETPKRLPDFKSVMDSWVYSLLFQASFSVIANPSFRSVMERDIELGLSTTIEFRDVRAPSAYLAPRAGFDVIGALLTFGGHNIPSRFILPDGGEAMVAVVTPLLAKELGEICGENRRTAIDMVRKGLLMRGYHHYCFDSRESVL